MQDILESDPKYPLDVQLEVFCVAQFALRVTQYFGKESYPVSFLGVFFCLENLLLLYCNALFVMRQVQVYRVHCYTIDESVWKRM